MLNTFFSKYLFPASTANGNASENEGEETKNGEDKMDDSWVFLEKPNEYYGDYEDNTDDEDNERNDSPIRYQLKETHSSSVEPAKPKKTGSPKLNGHTSTRSRRMSGSSAKGSRPSENFDLRECLSEDEQQQLEHSDFERYRGPYVNLLEDEQRRMRKEGGILSSASSQPEIVNIPSLEEHWILSPAPCFGGEPAACLKGSMEDLLIERPTASIYLKFIGKKNGLDSSSADRSDDGKSAEGAPSSLTCEEDGNEKGDTVDPEMTSVSGYFRQASEFNGADAGKSGVFESYMSTNFARSDRREEEVGWSSESSTRDHSLGRPPIRSFTVRSKHQRAKWGGMAADETSEVYEDVDEQDLLESIDSLEGHDSMFFVHPDDRVKNKRKLQPKRQRSDTRMQIWQKPRKPLCNQSGKYKH